MRRSSSKREHFGRVTMPFLLTAKTVLQGLKVAALIFLTAGWIPSAQADDTPGEEPTRMREGRGEGDAARMKRHGITSMRQGEGGSVVQGAAGPSGSTGEKTFLEKCDKPMGAMAIVEVQSAVLSHLLRYNLSSPVGVIRMMVQQSNCFIVIERGAGLANMMQERSLMNSGQLRQNTNIGGGQMVGADFLLKPDLVFSDRNAGAAGLGALAGGLLGPVGAVVGGVIGGLKFKEAQTSMLVSDARTGVQVASATGSSQKADLALGGLLLAGNLGSIGGAGLGGYQSTDEGKVIVASLVDNYNNIVRAVRGQPSLHRDVETLAKEAAAGGSTKAGVVFVEGDVLQPKINNVKLLAEPSDSATQIKKLTKSDDMIYMGEENNGFVRVETGDGGGWVKKIFVR